MFIINKDAHFQTSKIAVNFLNFFTFFFKIDAMLEKMLKKKISQNKTGVIEIKKKSTFIFSNYVFLK